MIDLCNINTMESNFDSLSSTDIFRESFSRRKLSK